VQLAEGSLRDATPIRSVAGDFLRELQGDSDQTLSTALTQTADQTLAIRSVQMSVLSIAIARAMKMTVEEQATVGSAAMLHDMALFELPENERHSPELMRPESRRVYESHPAIAYDMLERVRDIDGTVRIIVLQTHEQADGTGFPRRISITRTHRLARVVNLADAYLSLIGCGLGSQNIYPADAIAYLMHHSCQGRFDSVATCGLVRAVSIYPLGSLVQLSDNRTGKVARSVPGNPLSPIVSVAGDNGGSTLIDLEEASLTVERPMDEPSLGRRRLSTSELEKVLW
jgi:HD-GYP domain-containing protein (c-di-GMP phosphodiesterase class II)